MMDFKKCSDNWSNFYIFMFINIEIKRLNKIIDYLIDYILINEFKKRKLKINELLGNIK